MWNKLTAHIGIWLANMDREQSRLRESCSLSALNQRQLNIIRTSKSSDNIHRVTNRSSPQVATKSSIFSLNRKSRKSDTKRKANNVENTSKQKETHRTQTVGQSGTSQDIMTRSWNPNLPVSRSIFNFWRPSRSRSINNNNAVVNADSVSPTADNKQTTSKDEEILIRRRRPRSTHFDSNLLVLSPEKTNSIHDINELYRKIEKLGEGSYAVVYKSERKIDGRIVALKEIKLHNHEGLPFTAIREASLLRALQHTNIVTLHDIIYMHNHLVFVFEYMKTDLGKYLDNFRCGLKLVEVKLFLYQLLRGLAFCHERKIIHRDLKPQNLLLNEHGELKLADFGLARAKSVPSRTFSHEVVTLWYRPPDVLLGSTNYSTSLDMWGVGCIFAEMCTGYAIFPGTKDIIDQLHRIFGIRGVPDQEKWPEVSLLPHFQQNFYPPYRELPWKDVHSALPKLTNGQSLLSLFLQLNPADRISASAAMMHSYFSNLPSKIHLLPPTLSIFVLPEVHKMLH